jgi:hypothetical protein
MIAQCIHLDKDKDGLYICSLNKKQLGIAFLLCYKTEENEVIQCENFKTSHEIEKHRRIKIRSRS